MSDLKWLRVETVIRAIKSLEKKREIKIINPKYLDKIPFMI